MSSPQTLKRELLEKYARYWFCPFKCCVRSIQKLSQHLIAKHPHLAERDQMIKSAVITTKGTTKHQSPPPEQIKITTLWNTPVQKIEDTSSMRTHEQARKNIVLETSAQDVVKPSWNPNSNPNKIFKPTRQSKCSNQKPLVLAGPKSLVRIQVITYREPLNN